MIQSRAVRSGLLRVLGCFLLVAGGLVLVNGTAYAERIPKQLIVPSEPEGNKACLECHSKQESMVRDGEQISIHVDPAQYEGSAHSIISCTRCHLEAGPEHAKDPAKPLGLPTGRELRVLKSEGCVKCHAGLYEQSYKLSFHGVAVLNGDERAATCVDCHGVHNILPSRVPESMVSRQNVAQSCGTANCHPGAPESFAEGKEHFIPADKQSGGLHLLYKFFIGLILFDTMKDGPIVMFELLRRLMR